MFGWSIIASACRSASKPDGLGLLGNIHRPAPAFADLLQQLVAPQRLAPGLVIPRRRRADGGAGGGLEAVQQRRGLVMRGQQRLQPRA